VVEEGEARSMRRAFLAWRFSSFFCFFLAFRCLRRSRSCLADSGSSSLSAFFM
jgi:hypothetical protein